MRQKGGSNELRLIATEIMRARDLGLETETPFIPHLHIKHSHLVIRSSSFNLWHNERLES